MRPVLICDFDGTIVSVDTGRLILSRFADGDWQHYDDLYNRNEMHVEECLRHQFSMVRATKKSMIGAIEESVPLRPGFERLLELSDERRVRLLVASYGLDFCINHILGKVPQARDLRIYSPRTRVTPSGVRFTFPRRRSKDSLNLKDDLVGFYQRRGCTVAYVGDGTSDFPAMEIADVRFAIRGSRLAELCKNGGVQYSQITNFDQVAEGFIRPLSQNR